MKNDITSAAPEGRDAADEDVVDIWGVWVTSTAVASVVSAVEGASAMHQMLNFQPAQKV